MTAERDSSWKLAVVLLYLTGCIATGAFWEPSHDEGVAWRQAIGQLWLPDAEQPAAISELHAILAGATDRGAGQVLDALMIRGGLHPPAYYLMIHWWTELAGTGRIALNLPAYLFGVLSLFGIHRLARRLVSARSAPLWAMALLATSPWFVGFSNLAKPYGIVICLFLWSSNALLALHDDARRANAWRAAFVLLSALGLYSIYHYAFVVAWQGLLALLLAWRSPARNRELLWAAAMGLGIVICFAPWVPRLLTHLDISAADKHYFSGSIPISEWPALALGMLRIFGLGEGLRALGSDSFKLAWAALAIVTLPLAIGSFTHWAGPRIAKLEDTARIFWLSLPLFPLAILLGDVWRDTHTLFISKLCFPLVPLGLILTVRAWQTLRVPALATLGLTAWLGLFAVATTSNVYTRATSFTPFEAVAHALKSEDSPKHLVVLSSKAQGYVIPLLLTARELGVQNIRVGTVPVDRLGSLLDGVARSSEFDRVTLVDLAVTYRPQEMWRAKTLHRLRLRAEQAGWKVGRFVPGHQGNLGVLPQVRWSPANAEGPHNGKTLVLTELTNVKYYSMEASGNPGAIRLRP